MCNCLIPHDKNHIYFSAGGCCVCSHLGSSSPVGGEHGQCEHGHSHRSQLDKRDQLAADAAKNPLIHQVTAGVDWGASDQEQQVTQSQTGEEQVGHSPQRPHRQTRLHQGHVSHQAHHGDDSVESSDSDSREPDVELRRIRCRVPSPPGAIHSPAVLSL